MAGTIGVLVSTKADAWVYDHGDLVHVEFFKPGCIGHQSRLIEFWLYRPFTAEGLAIMERETRAELSRLNHL